MCNKCKTNISWITVIQYKCSFHHSFGISALHQHETRQISRHNHRVDFSENLDVSQTYIFVFVNKAVITLRPYLAVFSSRSMRLAVCYRWTAISTSTTPTRKFDDRSYGVVLAVCIDGQPRRPPTNTGSCLGLRPKSRYNVGGRLDWCTRVSTTTRFCDADRLRRQLRKATGMRWSIGGCQFWPYDAIFVSDWHHSYRVCSRRAEWGREDAYDDT